MPLQIRAGRLEAAECNCSKEVQQPCTIARLFVSVSKYLHPIVVATLFLRNVGDNDA